ncbi:MAG: NAD(P)/FAD-dependent oxidoreductase [Solirubrobacteraceae bacterium]
MKSRNVSGLAPTIVIGAGHNGLVCACYLARAGRDVLVLEASDRPGGGSRTEETVPGYRFDTHSVAHNIINMTSIPRELQLAEAGLDYREMDPFAIAVFADGRRVRFHRSVERTVASIAEIDAAEAEAYRVFMDEAMPLVGLVALGLQGGATPRELSGRLLRRMPQAVGVLRRGGLRLASELLGGYGTMLRHRLPSDLTRGPVSAFAAHAGAGPDLPGSALFGFWQAVYHRYGQWHAAGGSQGLVDALARRLRQLGASVRCDARVTRIDACSGRVRAVELAGGERIEAEAVVSAMHPATALLDLLHPPLHGPSARDLAATHASNSVQMLVHVAVDRLPPYTGARPGDHNGLQSFVDELDELQAAFHAAESRRMHLPAPAYAFTTSALDGGLAPPGHHTVYLACPAAPFAVEGGWERAAPAVVESLLDQVETRAPGFRDSIQGMSVRTPELMARELRWPGAHPMHLDVTLDQLGPLRPIPALGSHRTPVRGMYVSGAGTAPSGGIAGGPGHGAARALLADLG